MIRIHSVFGQKLIGQNVLVGLGSRHQLFTELGMGDMDQGQRPLADGAALHGGDTKFSNNVVNLVSIG